MGYFPRDEQGEKATDGIWSKGHTDCEYIVHTSSGVGVRKRRR
jgi:hypothetical protein